MVRRRGPLVTGRLKTAAGADLGVCLVVCAVLLSLPTVLSMHGGKQGVGGVLLVTLAVTVCIRLLPWDDRDTRWLLAWPIILFAALVALALAGHSSVSTVSGLPVLGFFYVGLTQPRWTGVALLPFGLVAWVADDGGWSDAHAILLRLPITIGVWVIVSESLSALRGRLQDLTAEMRGQALEDSLTGLASRRAFDNRVDGLRMGDAVVVIDLDNFKQLNDQQGHLAGDLVLADFGVILRASIRSGDLAARYGGEEFVLVLVSTGAEGATSLINRLREQWKVMHPSVTFSAGIAIVGEKRLGALAVAEADRALYGAKAAGRDTTVVASA